MLRAPAVAPHHVLPVDIKERHIVDITHVQRVAVNPGAFVLLGESGIFQPCVCLGVQSVVQTRGNHAVGPFVKAHQLCRQTDMLICVRTVVVHLHLAGLGLLGGDKHNAAGRLATVDRCSGVLEEVHALDVGGVDKAEVVDAFVFHTVNNNERSRGVFRHCATEAHIPAFVAGSGRVTCDDNTRHLALESLHRA